MKIKTDNDITLITLRLKSAREIYDCIDRSRDFLGKWMPWVETTKSYKDTEAYIKSAKDKHRDKSDLVFEIRQKDKFIGLIGLKDIDHTNKKAEIGYWLGEEYSGKGIMTRSSKVLIDYAFDELKLNRIMIRCAVENIRSCNIPRQLGFAFEGIERQGERIYGRYQDLKVYSLLKKEWR